MSATGATQPRLRLLEIAGNAIIGGMESSVIQLVTHLPTSRFAVTVLCPFEGRFAERLRALGADVIITALPADEVSWSSLQAACALIRTRNIDVIHAHLANAHLLAGLAGRLTETPVVATIHGRQITQLDFEAQRLTTSNLHLVCRGTATHALGLGIDAARLHCIPNGVDLRVFRPRERLPDGPRRQWGVPPDVPLVGFVGRLSPEKGPEVFLRMAAVLHQNNPDVHYLMLGDGPMLGDLVTQSRTLGLRRHLHFAAATEDVAPAYAELDVLAQCSHSEAMPLVLMEAMASGLPVVATHVGGVPEIVVPGITGWLVAPGDYQQIATRVGELLTARELRLRMGAAARRHAEGTFGLDRTVDALVQLFCTVSGVTLQPPAAARDAMSVVQARA